MIEHVISVCVYQWCEGGGDMCTNKDVGRREYYH